MAVHLGTTLELTPGGTTVALTSAHDASPARVPLDVAAPAAATPDWARYVAGVVAELRPQVGGRGTVSTTLPVGAGLSSSAALAVAAIGRAHVCTPVTHTQLGCRLLLD